MANLPQLATKAIGLLESGAELEAIYPLLRKITPEQKRLYGKHPGPTISLRCSQDGYWELWTTAGSETDFTHSASWRDGDRLTSDEDAELRQHMVMILKTWLAEDSLYAEPMAKQDAADRLDVSTRTLARWIDDGTPRAIELNKNTIRPLKTDLPPK